MSADATKGIFEAGGLANYISGSFMAGGELRLMFATDGYLMLGGHVGGIF